MEPDDTCSVFGCHRPRLAKGFCSPHYQRWHRYGDPLGKYSFHGDGQRFIQEIAIPFESSECLLWPYGKDGRGYARVLHEGKIALTHRVLCEKVHGAAPSLAHEAAHNCGHGNLGCCNPLHLRWATPKENQGDRLAHGTHNRGKQSAVAKLKQEDVAAIRKLAASVTRKDLSEMFGVTRQCIGHVVRGLTWKDSHELGK